MAFADVIQKTEFFLNNSPKDCTVTAVSSVPSPYSSIKILIKIEGPTAVIYQNDGFDSYDFSSPDMDSGTSDFTLSSVELPLNSVGGTVVSGSYTVYARFQYDGDIGTNAEVSDTYSFCFTNPAAVLSVQSSCETSTLTSSDVSTYQVTCNGTDIDPDETPVRTHTIAYPTETPSPIPNETQDADDITIGPNIYTGVYVVSLSTILQYTLPTGLIVYTTVNTSQNHTVKCDDCECTYRTCIAAIITEYESVVGSNLARANELQTTLLRLQANWMMYRMARDCGDTDSAAFYCSEITAIVNDERCECSTTYTAGVLITPTAALSGSGGGTTTFYNQWRIGTTTPPSGLGNDNDLYLQSDGSVYRKISGVWTLQFSIVGPTGVSGDAGVAILYNDVENEFAATTETTLGSYIVPANTLTADGDILEIEALVKFENGTVSDRTLKVVIDGTDEETLIYDGQQDYVNVKILISRVSASGVGSSKYKITYDKAISPVERTISYKERDYDWTSELPILITGVKASAGSNNDFTSLLNIVKLTKKIS